MTLGRRVYKYSLINHVLIRITINVIDRQTDIYFNDIAVFFVCIDFLYM